MIQRSLLHPDFGVDDEWRIYVNRDGRWQSVNQTQGKNGYWRAQTTIHCRVTVAYVHVLFCERFNGPRPTPAHEVRHLDGDRSHNWPLNLKWGTRKENAEDRDLHGTQLYGERGPRAKLTTEQVAAIILAPGPQSKIAADFGISQSLVSRIRTTKRWKRAGRRKAADAIAKQLDRKTGESNG